MTFLKYLSFPPLVRGCKTNFQKIRDNYLKLEKCWEAVVDLSSLSSEEIAIHEAHKDAAHSCHFSYEDPLTGVKVFTRYYHFLNGKCCGEACRHCTYNYSDVPDNIKKHKKFNSSFWIDGPHAIESEKKHIANLKNLIKDQHIAISIHVPKLLEWLISRRHCKNEWQPEAVKIRTKINAAIQDMPANETIASLLSGTYINYFHCLKIIEILEKTEADSKNIFGSYTSKRMKDWKEIVSLYKKNNVYLAEAAELLINIVKYELPNMKKLISKQQQLQNEAKKKEVEALKSANTSRNDLNSFLKEVGLDTGEGSYKKRLVANARQLNATHEKVASETKNVQPALEHYINFTAISLPHHTVNLNLIKYIAEKGNTTVYEFLHGGAPTQIIPPPPIFTEDEPEETNEDTIDWGFDEVNASLEAQSTFTMDDVVDLGFEEENADNKTQVELVELADLATKDVVESKEEKLPDKTARGDKAITIFENTQTRTNFINQLLELKSFLKMRLVDARKEGPIDDLVESVVGLEEMLKSIESVISLLLSKTSQHFFNILFLPNYLDGLVAKINEKSEAIERWTMIAALSKEREAEAVAEVSELTKKAQVIVRKGRELQEEIRKDISERYSGRTVTLMGGPTFDRH